MAGEGTGGTDGAPPIRVAPEVLALVEDDSHLDFGDALAGEPAGGGGGATSRHGKRGKGHPQGVPLRPPPLPGWRGHTLDGMRGPGLGGR